MAVAPDRSTRIASDLFDSATLEGARQSRSAKQQLDHWVRVGRSVSAQQSAARLRIEAVFAGTLAMRELSSEEGVIFNAEVQAGVEERLRGTNFGALLAAEGVTTVALEDDGRLIEHRPDGSTRIVEAA